MRKILLMIPIFVFPVAGSAEAAKQIKVLTTTSEGVAVRAKIKLKVFPTGETNAYVLREGKGYSIISVESCDDFVSLSAVPDVIGINRKINDDVPDWLPCEEPEVVFNDFQIQRLTLSVNNPAYSSADFWQQTLGVDAETTRPELPGILAEAFRNQEYGKISIITTELQQALRTAGKSQDADFLYALAIDASANGVLSANGRADLINDALRYSSETNRFELTTDAQAIVRNYQTETLRLPQNSQNLGRIDWSTMRSLQGGATVAVPDYTLGAGEIQSFEVKQELFEINPG